jgi:hypothetical protein
MGRLFMILAAAALMAFAGTPRGVTDPRAFVAQTLEAYRAHPDSPPPDATYAYSPRLARLFADYNRWARRHEDLVGSLDFDWWVNAQDWEITNISVTQRDLAPDRREVTARWRNTDRDDASRFLFVRDHGRWYLDDVVNGAGSGDEGWTLSVLLQQREVP